MELLPHARFCNLYGPTETNVCTWYEVAAAARRATERSRSAAPIADVELFAVDEDGRRVAPGEVGRAVVRGPTVMQGYWGDAERTRARRSSGRRTDRRARLPHRRSGHARRRRRRLDLPRPARQPDQEPRLPDRARRDRGGALCASRRVVECAVVADPGRAVANRLKAFVVVNDGRPTRSVDEPLPRASAAAT